MQTAKLLGTAALSLLAVAAVSPDATAADWTSSANVGFVTEYSFRGIAQSDEHAAVQGGFDISHDSGIYAGIWGSNVDFNDSSEATIETDIYAGYSNALDNGLAYDIGAIYYAYPGANSSLNYDFWEAALALGYDFDGFSTSVSYNYSPEYFGDSGNAHYGALNVDVPLEYDFTLTGHYGYQYIEDEASFGIGEDTYSDWSIGLGYNFAGFDMSLSYVDTDLDEPSECADGCDARGIFGISKSF